MFNDIINNIALIVALSLVYSFICRTWKESAATQQAATGLLFGAIAVAGMMNPVAYAPGIIFDGRTIIICAAGFIAGPLAAGIAAVLSAAYRYNLGGGAVMGISTIGAAAGIGAAYYYLRRRNPVFDSPLYLYGLGVAVHLCMLALTMTLPPDARFVTLKNIALPVILIYPVSTVLICLFLLDQQRRLHAEAALRVSESKYRELVENANSCIVRWTKNGGITFINEYGLKFFGYAESELIGRNLVGTIIPETESTGRDPGHFIDDISSRPEDFHHTITETMRRNGELVWVAWTNKITYDNQGHVDYILSIASDITERRRAEIALQTVSLRQGSMLAAIPDILMEVDCNKRYVWANTAGREFFGDDVLGREASFFFEGEQDTYDRVEKIFQGCEDSLYLESPQRRRDGQIRLLAWYCHGLKDAEGNVTGTISSARDITDERRIGEALQRTESLQKAILDTIPDLAWIKDADGVYLDVNKAFIKISGRPAEEIIGATDTDLWPAELAAQYRSDDAVVRKEAERKIFEEHIVDASGAVLQLETAKSPLWDITGKFLGTVGISRDITERKKMADDLRLASRKWRTTFDAMLDSVALLDTAGIIQQCNRVFAEFVGLDFPAILGRKCSMLVHGTEDHIPGCPVVRALKTGNRETMELTAGETIILVTADPITGDDGAITGFVHIMSDITERKRSEQAMQELTMAIEQSRDGIVFADPDGRLSFVNNAWARMHGYRVEELTGRHLSIFHTPEQLAREVIPFNQAALADGAHSGEVGHVRRDGIAFPTFMTTSAVFDDGTPRGYIAIARDITGNKAAEEALAETQRALQTLIFNLQGFMYRCINDGNWSMQYISDGVAALTGYAPNDVIDNARISYADIIHPDDRAMVYDQVQVAVRERRHFELMYRIYTADGQLKWFLEKGVGVVSPAGDSVCLEGFVTDITEHKHTQESLEAKNTELERFTYTISHDLKSPLVTIRTFLGHLPEDIKCGEEQRVMQDIIYIDSAAARMNLMLDDLLQLSRIGRMVNLPVETPLQDLAADAVAMVAGMIKNRHISLVVSPEPVTLYGDRARLVQVFQNLIENAAKFMGPQAGPKVEIGAEQTNGTVLCFVRDNGMGIDPRHQSKLFDLFEKLDENAEGTGIGLALVKRIIETHGGRIWVESEGIGKGACFRFTLPKKEVQG